MLVAMVAMFAEAGTTDIPTLMIHEFDFADMKILGLHIMGGMQTLLFLAFFCQLRRKNADVACAHLAARCTCAGTHGRFRCFGGYPFENGGIWVLAL